MCCGNWCKLEVTVSDAASPVACPADSEFRASRFKLVTGRGPSVEVPVGIVTAGLNRGTGTEDISASGYSDRENTPPWRLALLPKGCGQAGGEYFPVASKLQRSPDRSLRNECLTISKQNVPRPGGDPPGYKPPGAVLVKGQCRLLSFASPTQVLGACTSSVLGY